MTHIQKTAPGPPTAMAVATPAMLPVPTREAVETIRAWNEETLFLPGTCLRSVRCLIMSLNPRNWMNFVRMEKYSPVKMRRNTRKYVYIYVSMVSVTATSASMDGLSCMHAAAHRGDMLLQLHNAVFYRSMTRLCRFKGIKSTPMRKKEPSCGCAAALRRMFMHASSRARRRMRGATGSVCTALPAPRRMGAHGRGRRGILATRLLPVA